MIELNGKAAVIALGGNAITRPEKEDTIANQFANTRQSLDGIVDLARDGYKLVISHGNGPQVGNAILRVELARSQAPILPLGICVADTEGGMGYMIEQSLQNRLRQENIDRPVVTIISQVLVDFEDPQIKNPTKYIGQFYSEENARKYEKERDWIMKKDSDRGWRRVVASPRPLTVVEAETIKHLIDKGTIVIAVGGGGIPVYIDGNGNYEGVDAVVDKDFASAVLAHEINSEFLLILTSVDKVAINFGQKNQKYLDKITVSEAKEYLSKRHFPPGSMGPKVEAAIQFIEGGGREVIITSIENAGQALRGSVGTRIVRD